MAERNDSHLLNGGEDSMGMTDNQYKGKRFLIWQSKPGTPKFRKRWKNKSQRSTKS